MCGGLMAMSCQRIAGSIDMVCPDYPRTAILLLANAFEHLAGTGRELGPDMNEWLEMEVI